MQETCIRSKREAYTLYLRGAFGNKLRVWSSFAEVIACGYKGTLTLRYQMPDKPFCSYLVPVEQVPTVIASWKANGADERLISYNESAPDSRIIFQGEYVVVNGEEWLFSSTHKGNMRDALKTATHTQGAAVRPLLRRSMTPASYDDFCVLTDLYPTSVIELGVYDCELGTIPGRNTIIWEVRDY